VTRECFCYDTGFFDSGSVDTVGSGGGTNTGTVQFEWSVDLSSFNKEHSTNVSKAHHNHNNYNQGQGQGDYLEQDRRCRWENVFYWVIKLIGSGVYDLRRTELDEICQEYICYRE
jgi:hypothetical protein